VFFGTYSVRIDEKGRFFLPARFRDEVSEGVVVMPDAKKCLTVLTVADFQRRAADLESAKLGSQKTQDYSRFIGSVMTMDVPDKQGRVTLTPALMAHAGLERDGMVIGAVHRAEIWAPEAWEAEKERIAAFAAQIDSGEEPAVL
jgi:MraZ protein